VHVCAAAPNYLLASADPFYPIFLFSQVKETPAALIGTVTVTYSKIRGVIPGPSRLVVKTCNSGPHGASARQRP
jgi:hypothetical protein